MMRIVPSLRLNEYLYATLCYEEQGRALYYMALLNGHRHKNTHNKVVRQFCCHFNKEDMKYMYVQAFAAKLQGNHWHLYWQEW